MDVDLHHELSERAQRSASVVRSSAHGRYYRLASLWCVCVFLASWAAPALALSIEVTHAGPSLVGEEHAFSVVATDAVGEVTYEWRFEETGMFEVGGPDASHVFAAPGLFSVDVAAIDEGGGTASAYFRHLVHHPLTDARPTSSSGIIYDETRNRVYVVNSDNDSISAIDADGLVLEGELAVYRKPEALALMPDGKLWVVHQDDYAVAVVDPDQFVIERGFRLPYASQPVGIAVSPTGDAAYVSLMAIGKLLKLDVATGDIIAEADVGPRPRGIAVSHDGATVYVTRFISPDEGGEVVEVDAEAMTVRSRILLPIDSETVDSDQMARGLPNYLFAVALTPDGRQAWVPGKKDNILRGTLRDGQDLTHDTTLRPHCSIIDTGAAAEIYESRIDLDDRSQPVHVEFSPYGNFAILTLAGSNRIEIRDVNQPDQVFSAIGNVGKFPRAAVLGSGGRLFVQGALSRDVLVYDVSLLLEAFDQGTPPLLDSITTVAEEKLPPEVLEGKKLFHDAEDPRMGFEGYISCGGCHFEGIDDGRVYDFTDRGEGLRNTLSLLGQGANPGNLNWSGNLDEIQDFEHQIRELFDGLGFIDDEVLAMGTWSEPLGDSKAGLSPELDALAAYVRSLDRVSPSPYRNPDGSLTPDAELGKAAFLKLGCDICHRGAAMSDSESGLLHDVGTITEQSGTRAGELLYGLDTPTLLGVWETPPYLHDGSAPTLRDVLTTNNPDGMHGYVSALPPEQVDQLVAYLMQIDAELPIERLPFEPPAPDLPDDDAEVMADDAPSDSSDDAPGDVEAPPMSSAGPDLSGDGDAPSAGGGVPPSSSAPGEGVSAEGTQTSNRGADDSGCAVSHGRARSSSSASMTLLLGLSWVVIRRRRRHAAPLLAALALLVSACGDAQEQGPEGNGAPQPSGQGQAEPQASQGSPTDDPWSSLPEVTHLDPELASLGTRAATLNRVCARGRGDSFANALCGESRPEIDGMGALLELTGLSDERAFALTGNSTSLVAKSVSAINPRVIVFPRVESDLQRPETMTAIGFVRGEPFVEIVSRDLNTDEYNFYLLHFEQACSYESSGCDLASLLTEELEHGWTAYSVYDHDDLEPTSFDCVSCHQPGPPGSGRILRMQELTSPWLHWFPQRFGQRTESDKVLLAQFAETHEGETQYGGIPLSTITNAIDEGSGAQLEALVRAEGFGEQPNPFDAQIAREMQSGDSPTWQQRFDTHLRGEAIAVPYPQIDVSDEALRSAAIQSYRDVVAQLAPRESLLDIREIFSTDAQQKLSFVPTPGADGRTVLQQMCARCHDGRGNPALAKNKFNVLQLDQLSRAQKDVAINRISATDETRMPPWRVGTLTPEAVQAAIAELQK